MEHTATPWEVRKHNEVFYIFSGEQELARMQFTPRHEDEANAAYAVKAANLYPELVKTLQDIVKANDIGMGQKAKKLRIDIARDLLERLGELVYGIAGFST